MEPDTKNDLEALLNENLRLTRENNKLLRKLHRAYLIQVWSRILIILIVIGVPILVYQYYLEDYVKRFQATYDETRLELRQVDEVLEKLKNLPAGIL